MADIPGLSGAERGIAAIGILQAGMVAFDAYSTLLSSPWTIYNVGADQDKADAARKYYRHAVTFSMGYAAISAYIAGGRMGLYILLGAAGANAYLVWLYEGAIRKAQGSGYNGGWF